MTNLVNFRDLGGIETLNGGQTKMSLLFRGGPLANLTPSDTQYITEHVKLEKILDLRTDSEIRNLPNDKIGISITQLDLTKSDSESADPSEFMKLMDLDRVRTHMRLLYKNLPINPQAQGCFKELFAFLQNVDGPIYFHCTAGKDRTGMSAALILHTLGVSKEDIIKDYLKSNDNIQEILKSVTRSYGTEAQQKFENIDDVDQRVMKALLGVEEEYMIQFFDSIESNFGSIDSYIRDVLSISDKQRASLISKYVD